MTLKKKNQVIKKSEAYNSILLRHLDHIFIGLISLVTILLYFPIFKNPFFFDDYDFLFHWKQIQSFSYIPELLAGNVPVGHEGVYRPVRSLLYLLDFHIAKQNLTFYHAQAVIIYVLCSIFVYIITKNLIGRRLPAFVTSIFFVILPVHVESVSYVTASFDTVGILFAFISFYFIQRAFSQNSKKNIFTIFSIVFALFAFFTYELTLVLPFLAVLCGISTRQKQKLTLYGIYFACFITYFFIRIIIFHIPSRGELLPNIQQKIILIPSVITSYASEVILPMETGIPVNLSQKRLNYVFKNIRQQKSKTVIQTKPDINFFISLILISVSLIISVKMLSKHRLISFSILWFYICLIPVGYVFLESSKYSITQPLSVRYLLFSSYGACLLFGLLLESLITSFNTKNINYFFLYPKIFVIIGIFVLGVSYILISRHNLSEWSSQKNINLINSAVLLFKKTDKKTIGL